MLKTPNLSEPVSPQAPSLLGFLWSHRRSFGPGLFFALGRILCIAPFPVIFKHILDVQMPERDLRGILTLGVLMVGLLVLHQILSVRGATLLGKAVAAMVLRLREAVFHKVQMLSFGYLDRAKTGELLAKYAFDTQKIDGVAMPILNGFIPNATYSLITMGILVTLNWQLAAVVLLMLPVFAFARTYYFRKMKARHRDNRVKQEEMTGIATEFFGALRLVRSFGEEGRTREQLNEKNEDVAQSRVSMIQISSSFGAFSWGSIQFLTLIVVAGGAILSIYGHVTPGLVLAFVAGLPPLVQPIQMFANLSDQYFLGQEAYKSLRELLDEADTEQWTGDKQWSPIQGRLEFDGVTFRYPGAERHALQELNLIVEPGQRVALVGASGAGKSTVVNLLLGLYAPQSGEVRIDGVPQRDIDMRWFRRQTAIVMQDSVLLSGTIADNLRFGKSDASDGALREAARLAHADVFIDELPDGFDTVVGERGVMLSGGQKQRLAIARALLRDPAILLLDEPTSALDYESERLIQDALDTLTRGRTVVTIAHRLSTIRNAERILVLDQGKVVEAGTFDELSADGRHFQRMLKAQVGDAEGLVAG